VRCVQCEGMVKIWFGGRDGAKLVSSIIDGGFSRRGKTTVMVMEGVFGLISLYHIVGVEQHNRENIRSLNA